MKTLKDIRKSKGFTQEQIAEILEIKQSAVSKIELGKNTINNEQMKKLILALQMNTDEILEMLEVKDILGDK